jgi:sterol desaturase/sphingolipid hydroxylase (fatty acid hydroxylase superfamily)
MSVLNAGLCLPLAQYENLVENKEHPWTMEVDKLPSPSTFALSLVFCMMCEDFFFSMSHRILHTPFLYQHIHKIHHTHIITIGIAS